MRRGTLEKLARCLDPNRQRDELDRIAIARRVLLGLCDPEVRFAEYIADQISAIVSDIDDGNGGRDLCIDRGAALRAWIKIVNHEMCRAMIRCTLAVEFADRHCNPDQAVQIAVKALSVPSDSLIDSFSSSAAQVVETWDYRPLDQVSVSAARCCQEWNDLMVYLAR